MKKYVKIIAAFCMICLCVMVGHINSRADDATVTIALTSTDISMGDTVTATVTVSGSDVSQYDIYVTYDSSVLEYNSGSGAAQANGSGGTIRLVGGTGSTSLTFSAVANGSCYISTSGTEVYNINYEQVSITHAGANVNVSTNESTTEAATAESTTEAATTEQTSGTAQAATEVTTESTTQSTTEDTTETTTEQEMSANCNLSELKVSPGTLEPEFSYSTTSYQVTLDAGETSIVISATPEDSNASTAVTGADKLTDGENTVKVMVTAENGAVKIYNISVLVGEAVDEAAITIDGVKYHFLDDYTDVVIPEGYSAITSSYNNQDIEAYESPNKQLVIVCLMNEDSETGWFIYNQTDGTFIPYCEYSANYNRYIILDVPEGIYVPDGYYAVELELNGSNVAAYQTDSVDDKHLYLVYAMNIEGSEGFYRYDVLEGSFMRYVPSVVSDSSVDANEQTTNTDATMTDAVIPDKGDRETFSKQTATYIITILSVLLVVFVISTIVLAVKKKAVGNELEQAELMMEHLAAGKEENVSDWFGDEAEEKQIQIPPIVNLSGKNDAYDEEDKKEDIENIRDTEDTENIEDIEDIEDVEDID